MCVYMCVWVYVCMCVWGGSHQKLLAIIFALSETQEIRNQ